MCYRNWARIFVPTVLLAVVGAVVLACGGGKDGASCTVADNGDGTSTISCPDGTTTVVHAPDGGAAGSGKSSLVRQDPEPAGKNCPNGGVAIKSGVDSNGDGKLEDGEVTSTSYLCNPAAAGGDGGRLGTAALPV